MKKYLIILTAFLFVFSCSEDEREEQNDANMLKGKYNLVTLASDIPLDLNHDGNATTDMLQELDFAYYTYNKILKIHSTPLYGNNYYLYNGWILAAQFWPQYNDYEIHNYKPMHFGGSILKYDRNTNILEYDVDPPFVHHPAFPEDIFTPTTPIVTNMEILPDMKIKITMQHRYTETPETYPDCWTNIVLTAVYEKYSDNPD
ncbi:MAG: hypothetical protein LBE36_07270 [Flavobacteriaceae bacterium]|jgi:hypothetical protein|nr:hypothetical protein [Flavobacteriaceae bacterium]